MEGQNQKLKIQSIHKKVQDIFGSATMENDSSEALESEHYLEEYMQEINDLIIKSLYTEIIANTRGRDNLARDENMFQQKYMNLAEWVTPQDFEIPEAQINEFNMPIWNKAIKEL